MPGEPDDQTPGSPRSVSIDAGFRADEVQAPSSLQPAEYKGVFLIFVGVIGSYLVLGIVHHWPLIVGAYFWLWAMRNTLLQRGATRLKKVDGGIISFLPSVGMGAYLAATAGCHAPVVSILTVALGIIPGLNYLLLLYGLLSNFLGGHTFAHFCGKMLHGASVTFGSVLSVYATLMVLFWLVAAPATTIWRAMWQIGCPVPDPGEAPVHS
mmetsp:Transcript_17367/g.44904  ORF Transcript_17367/g.44904 Transcript_17367/m.44904 type:complete len:210 (-) Transcript_17367:76-705(-)